MPDNPTTAALPCVHCFCKIATNGDLRCHRCGATKPYEDPKPHPCLMCNGTGITYQARSHDSDFESEPAFMSTACNAEYNESGNHDKECERGLYLQINALEAEIATFRNASPSLCNCSQCLDLRKE